MNPTEIPSAGQSNRYRFSSYGPSAGTPPPAPKRHRLAHWIAQGMVPLGMAPCTIAAAYARATGRPPARDPQRRACRAYSAAELRLALAGLAAEPPPPPPPPPPVQPLAPPADPLTLIWVAALQRLTLPSTRLLLRQQARLLELRESTYPNRTPGELVALVAVASNWLPLVESRRDLVANGFNETLGRLVVLELVGVQL